MERRGVRKRLLTDPKPVLAEFGLNLPASVSVQIHENTPRLMNAVLPKEPAELPTTASNDPITRTLERAWTDPAFKTKLLSDPKEAVAEMGVKLPESMDLKVWENTDNVEHMVLPMDPKVTELSDADLEAVAGGGLSKGVQTATGCGVASGVAGGVGAALAFTLVGGIVGGIAAGAAGAGSAAGGAIASGGGKC